MTDRLGDEKGSSPVSGKGWRAWPSRLGGDELPEILFFAVISVLYLLFWRPIQGVMRIRNTERFKHLAQLNLDALCRELLDGRDFDSLVDVEQRAREGELREVANHISEQCALGALDRGYPQLVEIFYRKRFWVHLNGYAASLFHNGFAMGFYLGVGVVLLGIWLL